MNTRGMHKTPVRGYKSIRVPDGAGGDSETWDTVNFLTGFAHITQGVPKNLEVFDQDVCTHTIYYHGLDTLTRNDWIMASQVVNGQRLWRDLYRVVVLLPRDRVGRIGNDQRIALCERTQTEFREPEVYAQ